MRDAAEYCGFNQILASKITPYLPDGTCVCDAGCGLGYLSLALSKYCRSVTAVDIEPLALSVLSENVERRGIENIDVTEGDIAAFSSEIPFDAMIFSFFGGTREALLRGKKRCRGKVILIRKDWENHRFTIAKKSLKVTTLSGAASELEYFGIPYVRDIFSLQMGQPFRSLADAVDFFRIYSKDANPGKISESDIIGRLERISSGEFKYFMPSFESVGMLIVDVCDIPELPITEGIL